MNSGGKAWYLLMCVLVMLGITIALVDGAHVRIDIFSRLLPARGKSAANVVFRLCGVGAALAIACGGYVLACQSAATGRIDYGLFEMLLWLPQALIALGGIISRPRFFSCRERRRGKQGQRNIPVNAGRENA